METLPYYTFIQQSSYLVEYVCLFDYLFGCLFDYLFGCLFVSTANSKQAHIYNVH